MKQLTENEIIEKVFSEGLFSNLVKNTSRLKKNIQEETINNAVRDFIKKLNSYPKTARKFQLISYLEKFIINKFSKDQTMQEKPADSSEKDADFSNEKTDIIGAVDRFIKILDKNTLDSSGKLFLKNLLNKYKENPKKFTVSFNQNQINSKTADKFYNLKDVILKRIKQVSNEKDSETKQIEISILEKIYEIMNKE